MAKKQEEQKAVKISMYDPFRNAFCEMEVEKVRKLIRVAREAEKKLQELGL